jgi:uncharacterized protein YjbK
MHHTQFGSKTEYITIKSVFTVYTVDQQRNYYIATDIANITNQCYLLLCHVKNICHAI